MTASAASEPVASAVFFIDRDTATYKFGASNQRGRELRANNLVMWEAIKALKERGSNNLHFGRTSLNNDGLRRFKLSWGTTEEQLNYFKYDLAAEKWARGKDQVSGFHNAIFSRMPLFLNQMAGALLYPHLD